jgi:hypothetical protein
MGFANAQPILLSQEFQHGERLSHRAQPDLGAADVAEPLHSLGVDPGGNLMTGKSQGDRVQTFAYKGLSTAATR